MTDITTHSCRFILVGLLCLTSLGACTTTNNITPLVDKTIIENVKESFPVVDESLFGAPIQIESAQQIIQLSAGQKQQFLEYYFHRDRGNKPGNQRLADYLSDVGLVFEYSGMTSNAETTLRTNSGNCMSLAVLTSALAHAADVDIKYQLVDRAPIYQEFGGLVFKTKHIRSLLYEPANTLEHSIVKSNGSATTTTVARSRRKIIIDYYPSRYTYANRVVSEDEFMGLYYRNLAAEALGEEDYNTSYWLLKHSLKIEPDNADAINSMAVLFKRIGKFDQAEQLYKYGIKTASNKIALLNNYRVLLISINRHEDAERITKELENVKDENPFSWLHAANELYEDGDYPGAIRLYEKAIKLAPYLHQGYFGIAKAQFARGYIDSAQKALTQAKEEAMDVASKSLYQAKLAALSRK